MAFTTASFVGLGQTLSYNGVTLLHITDVTYSANKIDTADTTDTASTNGYRTFLPALKEAGDVAVKGIWYPGDTTQEGLETLKGVVATWVHSLPNSLGTITYQGMLTAVDHTSPMDKAGEVNIKIKISGVSVYAHS